MKQTKTIKLDTIDKVKTFIARAMTYPGDLMARNTRYVVDGKSIMGLFSLDLSRDIIIETACDVPLTFADDFEIK